MGKLFSFCLVVVGLINLAPVLGIISAAKLEQAAGAGAIGLALVLLYLLKGKTQGLAQLVLTEPEQSATQTNPAADVDIHRVQRPGRVAVRRRTATAERLNLFHCRGSSSREMI